MSANKDGFVERVNRRIADAQRERRDAEEIEKSNEQVQSEDWAVRLSGRIAQAEIEARDRAKLEAVIANERTQSDAGAPGRIVQLEKSIERIQAAQAALEARAQS
jgi:hypothetical protein